MMKDKLISLTPVILAGGKGSRLGDLTKNIPKPLLRINDRYFIEYIFDKIISTGFTEVYISICYLKSKFINLIGHEYKNLKINYVEEETPLGTGGALKNIFERYCFESLLIFNGDSFCDFNLDLLIKKYFLERNNIILVCKIEDSRRFGNVVFDKDLKVIEFKEKKINKTGYINAGVYIINDSLKKIKKMSFSLEKDFFESNFLSNLYAYPCEEKFIDIGVPEALKLSNKFLSSLKN